MAFSTILLDKKDKIATITMNRPRSKNAYTTQMAEELNEALADVTRDAGVRVVVLTGAGDAFCAGPDFRMREVRTGTQTLEEALFCKEISDDLFRGDLFNAITRFILGLHRLDKLTIAMVGGDAAGAGMDMALACDMRIGSPRARFIVGFLRMGLAPDTGSAWFLPRIVGLNRAMELIMTAEPVPGEEAHRLGILNRLVPHERLEEETRAFAQHLAQGPPVAQRLAKLLVYRGLEQDLEGALIDGMAFMSIGLRTKDHLEAAGAFVERRAPVFHDR